MDGVSPRDIFYLAVNYDPVKPNSTTLALLTKWFRHAIATTEAYGKTHYNYSSTLPGWKTLAEFRKTALNLVEEDLDSAEKENILREGINTKLGSYREESVQETPHLSIDGDFANSFHPPSPNKKWMLLANEIRAGEQGDANPDADHRLVWQRMMENMGAPYPGGTHLSKEFAYSDYYADEAYVVPALQTAMGRIPGYWPEKLGEMMAYEIGTQGGYSTDAHAAQALGLDPTWHVMHRAADQFTTGHAGLILRAIEDYVKHPEPEDAHERDEGLLQRMHLMNNVFQQCREILQERSIYTRRKAWPWGQMEATPDFQGTCSKHEGRKQSFAETQPKKAVSVQNKHYDSMVELVRKFASEAKRFHISHKVNDASTWGGLMDTPSLFLQHLAKERNLVTPGRPEESGIFALMDCSGPMYMVFNETDQKLWSSWIRDLAIDDATGNQRAQRRTSVAVRGRPDDMTLYVDSHAEVYPVARSQIPVNRKLA
jgi:hypothetical protein